MRVVVQNFPLYPVFRNHASTVLKLSHLLFDFVKHLIALRVPHIRVLTALVVSDMIGNCHEDFVFADTSRRRFQVDLFLRFSQQDQDACLDAYKGLERVGMQINARENLRIS